MKKLFLLLFLVTSINYAQSNLNGSLITGWEGNWWRGNGNMGSWFPSFEDLATFSIDDYSWGEIRSLNQISFGTSINIETQIINSSGGTNYDAAFFAIGDGWAFYGGNNYGIVFRNGIVNFFEDNGIQNMTFKDTIGTYVIGEMISFTLTFNNDGTLSAQGAHFSGAYTPTTVVQNAKWIIASKDSRQNQGFYLKSIDGEDSITTTDWEGNWWSYNINMGSWFPSYEDLATFSIDDFSWGEIRSINQISSGTSINIEAQIINSSGGVNYDAAFFAIGDGWAFYGDHNYGIVFRNGIVNFFEDNGIQNMTFKDTIGTYVIGEMISFTLTFNNDGTLSAQGDLFSGTFTPTTIVQNAKWIIASKDSRQNQGFVLVQRKQEFSVS